MALQDSWWADCGVDTSKSVLYFRFTLLDFRAAMPRSLRLHYRGTCGGPAGFGPDRPLFMHQRLAAGWEAWSAPTCQLRPFELWSDELT